MYNHNKAQQSKNRVHISWDILYDNYGSAEGPPRGVENRNLLSHPDDLRMEAYVIRMT